MPTITFSLSDLNKLVGRKLSNDSVEKLLAYAKGELNSIHDDIATVSFDDTNLPYLWSTEGIARLFKGVLKIEKGIPKFNAVKSGNEIIVEADVEAIRPFIGGFIAKGKKISEELLKQMIQLQEKLCESYGRKRQKIAIGLYNFKKISFPIYYKAVLPKSVRFYPLESKVLMSLRDILSNHPKGRKYSWIIERFSKYPLLVDSKNEVLSFPPIINSDHLGKVNVNDSELFFEVTGTDFDSVALAANIFAQALYDRGFNIESLDTKYNNKRVTIPYEFNDAIKIKKEDAEKLIGASIKDIKQLLEMARFDIVQDTVKIPFFRKDIMHGVDIIEDIAIMHGYDNLAAAELTSYSIGSTSSSIKKINELRDLMLGLCYQEVLSQILSNKSLLYNKMNIDDFGTIEIENYMSDNYSVVRTWLIPGLLETLSKNKHVSYPQKIFEQGLITTNDAKDFERIACVTCHEQANYTEIKQVVDALFRSIGYEYEIIEIEHKSFITGRVGRILVKGKKIGFVGEISPNVLSNFQLEMPVSAMEINLTALFGWD